MILVVGGLNAMVGLGCVYSPCVHLEGQQWGALTRRQRRDGEETTCSFEQVVALISHLTSLQEGRRS